MGKVNWMKRVLLAGAIAILTSGAAIAADLPSRKEPPAYIPPPPLLTWAGFYVGLNAGYTWGESDHVNVGSFPVLGPPAGILALGATGVAPVKNDGFIGGGQVGYNWQFGERFVAGLEADIQGVANSGGAGNAASLVVAIPGVPVVTDIAATKSLDYLGTVRGRLGYLVTPTLLAYGTGGLAYGGVGASTAISQLGANGFSGFGASSFADTRVGWAAGGGLEWMFSPNWSAKAEYQYYDLGGVSHSSPLIAPPAVVYAVSQSATRFDGHVVRAGVNYHFNWAAPIVSKY